MKKDKIFKLIIILLLIILFFSCKLIIKDLKNQNISREITSKFEDSYTNEKEKITNEFENTYSKDISTNKSAIAEFNGNLIKQKEVLLYKALSKLEHDYYKDKYSDDELFSDALAEILLNNYYIQLVNTKGIGSIDNEQKEIIKHLQIQEKSKSPIISSTTKIRLKHREDFETWFNGKASYTLLENYVRENSNLDNGRDLGEAVFKYLITESKNYKILLNSDLLNEEIRSNVKLQLREFNFIIE